MINSQDAAYRMASVVPDLIRHSPPNSENDCDLALRWAAAFRDISTRAACCTQLKPRAPGYFLGQGWLSSSRVESSNELTAHKQTLRSKSKAQYVIQDVHILNPGSPTTRGDLVIADGIIQEIRSPGSPPPDGYSIMPFTSGLWVMPGLIDMHVHLPSDNVLKLTPHFMRMFIAHGVTGIRETGDVDGSAIPAALRWQIKNPALTPSLSYSKYFVGRPPFRWKNVLAYEGPADAQRIVNRLLAEGASCIKLYENLRQEDISLLKATAEEAGLVVLGHVPTQLTYEEANISDTQHFFGVPLPSTLRRDHVFSRTADWDSVTPQRIDQVLKHTEVSGLANTPTLTINKSLLTYQRLNEVSNITDGRMPSFFKDIIWHPQKGLPVYRNLQSDDFDALQRAFEKKKLLFEKLHRNGHDLFAGTDTMQPLSIPGYSLHQELHNFVEAGMSPTSALKAATLDSAKRLGWSTKGAVKAGFDADLILMEADPTKNLAALRKIKTVIVQGHPVDTHSLHGEIQADLQSRESTFVRISSRVLANLAMYLSARRFTA